MSRRRMIKNTLREISNKFDDIKYNKNLDCFYEDDNLKKSYINLDFSNYEDIYASFSNQNVLNGDLYDLVKNLYRYVNPSYQLEFNFYYPADMSNEERDKIEYLFRLHFVLLVIDKNKMIRRHNITAFILLVIGAFIYAGFGLLEYFNLNFIFRGIFEIFAWVFIWESCDFFFLTNMETKLERLNLIKIYNAKINRSEKNA